MSAWEFRTSTVSCDGKTLVLNHSSDSSLHQPSAVPAGGGARAGVAGPSALPASVGRQTDLQAGGMEAPGGSWTAFRRGPVDGIGRPGTADRDLAAGAGGRPSPGGVSAARGEPSAAPAGGRTVAASDVSSMAGTSARGGDPGCDRPVWKGPRRDLHAVAAGRLSVAVELTGWTMTRSEPVSITAGCSPVNGQTHEAVRPHRTDADRGCGVGT